MKIIPLRKGLALVDDEDYELLNSFNWKIHYQRGNPYLFTTSKVDNKKRIYMHRLIMKTPNNLVVDHIDHDTLNNQKYNLRNCTNSENLSNKLKRVWIPIRILRRNIKNQTYNQ